MTSERDEVEPWIQLLVQSLRGLSDPSQRAFKLLNSLTTKSPAEIMEFLQFLIESSTQDPLCQQAHLDLLSHREALGRLSYDQISTIYEMASEQNHPEIQALFRESSSRWTENEVKPEAFAQKLDSLTLGERKQLSRQIDGRHLEMLIFDESPQVVSHLLMNPKLTEKDVVRLASRQGAPEKVLEEVCKSTRWNRHYAIRKALVFNPSTPQVYALGFVRHLTHGDLKLLLQKGRNRPELTSTAEHMLQSKKES